MATDDTLYPWQLMILCIYDNWWYFVSMTTNDTLYPWQLMILCVTAGSVCCYRQSHRMEQVHAHWLWLSMALQYHHLLLHLVDALLLLKLLLPNVRTAQTTEQTERWPRYGPAQWNQWGSAARRFQGWTTQSKDRTEWRRPHKPEAALVMVA